MTPARRLAALLLPLTLCWALLLGGCSAESQQPGERIGKLVQGDVILLSDLSGSSLGEADWQGRRLSTVALHPYGVSRLDDSAESRKFAGNPRDEAVSLDHMGARFYAPELGIWTSGDPVAITAPERQIIADFAAANPYAYAGLSPVTHADRDGQFWQFLVGPTVGAAVGAGMEAFAQYREHGKVQDWGRIGAAASGGAVSGAITMTTPAVGLGHALGIGAAGSAAAGLAERLVASGGKSAGSLAEVALDAVAGAVGGAVAKGANAAIRKFVWPPNHGVIGGESRATLVRGQLVDRLGPPSGRYLAPQGTPVGALSLPAGGETRRRYTYEVMAPIEVHVGIARPWFGAEGGGLQFRPSETVAELVKSEHLLDITDN